MWLINQNTIQVAFAVALLTVLYKISHSLLLSDGVVALSPGKQTTVLFDGWVDASTFTDKQFDTYNVFATNYRKLLKSYNRNGTEFSYTVWVKLDDVSTRNLASKVLFLQGDKVHYPFTVVTEKGTTKTIHDYVVKCPLVKFAPNGRDLVVEFNSSDNVSETATINKVSNSDETIRHNILSLVPEKWMLLTFTFHDKVQHNKHEGVEFKFYINDVLYHTEFFKGMIRLNQGNVHILPNSSSISGGYLGDLTYHNFALMEQDIGRVLAKGIPRNQYSAMKQDADFNQPLYLTQYNKLDVYNL